MNGELLSLIGEVEGISVLLFSGSYYPVFIQMPLYDTGATMSIEQARELATALWEAANIAEGK